MMMASPVACMQTGDDCDPLLPGELEDVAGPPDDDVFDEDDDEDDDDDDTYGMTPTKIWMTTTMMMTRLTTGLTLRGTDRRRRA